MFSNAAMYVGNRYFTFGLSHDGFVGAYVRYLVVGAVVAGLTVVLLAGFVEGLAKVPRHPEDHPVLIVDLRVAGSVIIRPLHRWFLAPSMATGSLPRGIPRSLP